MILTAPTTKLEQAMNLLREWLKDGPKPAREIEQRIAGTAISSRLFDDAKAELNIASVRRENVWWWEPPPGLAREAGTPIDPDPERQKLLDAQAAIDQELAALVARLPDLAHDQAAFRDAHRQRIDLEGERERLTMLIAGYDRNKAHQGNQRAADERAKLQAAYDATDRDAKAALLRLRDALTEVAPLADLYRAHEQERERLGRELGISIQPNRYIQIIEAMAHNVFALGGVKHLRERYVSALQHAEATLKEDG